MSDPDARTDDLGSNDPIKSFDEPRTKRRSDALPAAGVAPLDPLLPHARLFTDRDPRAILARITNGDPLRLAERTGARLRERCYMLDAERVLQRVQARVAVRGASYDGTPDLERWLLEIIDGGIEALLAEDAEAERRGDPYEPWDPRFAYLSYAVAVIPEYQRTASVRFNGLPFEWRLSFFKLCIECISVEETLAMGLGPPDVLRERTLRALFSFTNACRYEDLSFVNADNEGREPPEDTA